MSGNGPRDEKRRIRRIERESKAKIAAAEIGKKIIGRSEAKTAGLVRYFTGTPCKNGHLAERTISNCVCVVCQVERVIAWQKRNPEITKRWMDESRKRYEERNADRVMNAKRSYKERHPERIKAQAADYYERNKDRLGASKAAWLAKNPSARAEWERTRAAIKRMAMPAWANRDKIKQFYKEANEQTVATGIKHSVDHYYPLQGKRVCGLHVEYNLQVIPLVDNLKKNRSMPSLA